MPPCLELVTRSRSGLFEAPPADEVAAQREQGFVEFEAPLSADGQALELPKQAEDPLNYVAEPTQTLDIQNALTRGLFRADVRAVHTGARPIQLAGRRSVRSRTPAPGAGVARRCPGAGRTGRPADTAGLLPVSAPATARATAAAAARSAPTSRRPRSTAESSHPVKPSDRHNSHVRSGHFNQDPVTSSLYTCAVVGLFAGMGLIMPHYFPGTERPHRTFSTGPYFQPVRRLRTRPFRPKGGLGVQPPEGWERGRKPLPGGASAVTMGAARQCDDSSGSARGARP